MNNNGMKKILLILSFTIALCYPAAWSQNAKPAETLTFHVTGFEKATGQALVYLYRRADKVPTKPFMHLKAEIVNHVSDITVNNLPYGEYAAIVVHDLNSNGKIDHKWGMPAEPMGYTNKWKLSLFSGMPTFEKLKFFYSDKNSTIVVQMKE